MKITSVGVKNKYFNAYVNKDNSDVDRIKGTCLRGLILWQTLRKTVDCVHKGRLAGYFKLNIQVM